MVSEVAQGTARHQVNNSRKCLHADWEALVNDSCPQTRTSLHFQTGYFPGHERHQAHQFPDSFSASPPEGDALLALPTRSNPSGRSPHPTKSLCCFPETRGAGSAIVLTDPLLSLCLPKPTGCTVQTLSLEKITSNHLKRVASHGVDNTSCVISPCTDIPPSTASLICHVSAQCLFLLKQR